MAETIFDLNDWQAVKGTARNYKNIKTGEVLSRRQFDKLRGISYETKAKINKAKNEKLQLLRPARGRKSALKLDSELKEAVATARKDRADALAEKKLIEAETKKQNTKFMRAMNKKIPTPKISKQSLKTGHMGVRKAFSSYEQYVELLTEAQRLGVIFMYGLGWTGVSDRDGQVGETRDVTVFKMADVKLMRSEEEFNEAFEESILEKQYMHFRNYFMHFGFDKEYARDRIRRSKDPKIKKKYSYMLKG